VKENMPVWTQVGMLIANDSDPGRNGKLLYSLVTNRHSRAFLLNSFSGTLSTGAVFDFENMQDTPLNVEVIVSDDGFPQKFSRASVYLTVEDVNDNCPVFNYAADVDITMLFKNDSNFVLLTIYASDADSKANGYVTHSIFPTSMRRYFAIDPINGTITVLQILQPNVYNFDVVATDYGRPPCASTKAIQLSVVSTEVTTPTTIKSSTLAKSTKSTSSFRPTHQTEEAKSTGIIKIMSLIDLLLTGQS
jgi:hypothetical protein